METAPCLVGWYEGISQTGGGIEDFGFIYSGGSYTTINVPGSEYTEAYGINDEGQIVGLYETPTTPSQPLSLFSRPASVRWDC